MERLYLHKSLFKGMPLTSVPAPKKTIVILGDSQTAGQMGRSLKKYYESKGFNVKRFGASGEGAKYFNQAITRPRSARQRAIYRAIKANPSHVVVSSIGGNDSSRSVADGTALYTKFFGTLKNLGVPVTVNGSPRSSSHSRAMRSLDRRRARIDGVQQKVAKQLGVKFNSVRSMGGGVNADGYHRHVMGKEYANWISKLDGMPDSVDASGKIKIVKAAKLPDPIPYSRKLGRYRPTKMKPVAPKSVAKPVAPKSVAKPTTSKPTAPKPVASKPMAKPTASKPTAPKPVAPKPVASKPVAPKPVASKPMAKPTAPKPVTSKPMAKPTAPKPTAKPTTPKEGKMDLKRFRKLISAPPSSKPYKGTFSKAVYLSEDLFKGVPKIRSGKLSQDQIWNLASKYGKKYGIDPVFVSGVIMNESRGSIRAQNKRTGARGLMQFMPGTAKTMGVKYKDLYNPEKAVDFGTKLLARQVNRYKKQGFSDPQKAAMVAYYGGPGNLKKLSKKYGTGENFVNKLKDTSYGRYWNKVQKFQEPFKKYLTSTPKATTTKPVTSSAVKVQAFKPKPTAPKPTAPKPTAPKPTAPKPTAKPTTPKGGKMDLKRFRKLIAAPSNPKSYESVAFSSSKHRKMAGVKPTKKTTASEKAVARPSESGNTRFKSQPFKPFSSK